MGLPSLLIGACAICICLTSACATAENATPGQKPVSTLVSSRSEGAAPARLDEKTESLQIEIKAKEAARHMPLRKRLIVSEKLLSGVSPQIVVEITGIPVSVPVHQVVENVWELEFPANVLQLLSKESGSARYSGILKFGTDTSLPFSLVFAAPAPAPRKQPKHSAG